MSAARRGRQHHPPVTVTADYEGQLDREIEIRTGDAQLIADQLEAHPGQHRECAGTAGGGATCSGERLGEGFAFATELHSVAFLTMR